MNSFRSADLASLRSSGEARNKIKLPAQREWIAAGGGLQMIGDGMVGSSSDVNQGTTTGGERAGRGLDQLDFVRPQAVRAMDALERT